MNLKRKAWRPRVSHLFLEPNQSIDVINKLDGLANYWAYKKPNHLTIDPVKNRWLLFTVSTFPSALGYNSDTTYPKELGHPKTMPQYK